MIEEYTFKTDGIASQKNGNVREIVGWAMTDDVDSYNSSMTQNAMESFLKQVKSKKIMIDVEHQSAFLHNVRSSLRKMMKKAGLSPDKVKDEVNTILQSIKFGQLPMGKIFDAFKEDGKVKLVTRTNDAFGDVNAEHRSYYNAVLKSIDNKQIDGYSISFFPTRFKNAEGRRMIDDLVVTGVALTGGRSNPNTGFTDVMTRCAMTGKTEELEVEVRMAKPEDVEQLRKEQEALKAELDALKRERAEREAKEAAELKAAEEAKLKAEAEAKEAAEAAKANEYEAMKKELDELKRQKEIAEAQGTHSAQRRGIAPEGNPSTEKVTEQFPDKVNDVLKQLDSTTMEKSPKLPRDGRLIVKPYEHKRNLIEAIRLQYAGRTHLQKNNAQYLAKDANDIVTTKE